MDGFMYHNNMNFRYLSKNHLKPGMKTRSNSKVKTTNYQTRNMSIVRQQANLKRWKHSVGMDIEVDDSNCLFVHENDVCCRKHIYLQECFLT